MNNANFSYSQDIYIPIDGVAMCFPLGPVLAGIFYGELKKVVRL